MAKKGLIGEFKDFISRGNAMDMAVGVIIGGAFSGIVTSLTEDIISPILGLFGGMNFDQALCKYPGRGHFKLWQVHHRYRQFPHHGIDHLLYHEGSQYLRGSGGKISPSGQGARG